MPPHDKTLNMAMQSTGKDAEQLARKLSTNVHRAVRADRTNHCRKYLETVDTNRKAQKGNSPPEKGVRARKDRNRANTRYVTP